MYRKTKLRSYDAAIMQAAALTLTPCSAFALFYPAVRDGYERVVDANG